MKTITIKTATEERNAVMGDYGITPESTGWTLNERNDHTIRVHENCRTRRQARAMWLEIFEDFIRDHEGDGLRTTDKAIMQAEAAFLAA